MLWLLVVALAVILPPASDASDSEPLVTYTIDFTHPDRSAPYPAQHEIRQIRRFVATVPGICHHIQEVHLQSAFDAEVRTGRRRPSWDDPHPDHGDKLYLHKRDGGWRIIRRTKWSYEGNGGLFRETP